MDTVVVTVSGIFLFLIGLLAVGVWAEIMDWLSGVEGGEPEADR